MSTRYAASRILSTALFLVTAQLMILVPPSHGRVTAAEKAAWVRDRCDGSPIDPWTDYVGVLVAEDGTFNAGAFQPEPWDILYAWPDVPGTSFTTIRVDGVDYPYGLDDYGGSYFVQPPFDLDALTNVSVWQRDDIVVSQTLQITTGTTTGNADTVRIQYDVMNVGNVPHDVGVRAMMDTEINYNDGAPFRIPGIGDAVTTETELIPPAVPQYYQAFFDLGDPVHVAQGTLIGADATPPDRFIMASWPSIVDSMWDYEVIPGKVFGSPDYPDSAVALYWLPQLLMPGESKRFTTYYGVGGISGSADLSISGPAQLDVVEAQWSPNPFTVVAYLQNNTVAALGGESLTLDLSGAPGLELAPGEAQQHPVPEVPPTETLQTAWSVTPLAPGTWTYRVVSALHPSLTAERTIIVPEINAECTPRAVEACQTELPGVCGQGTRTCSTDGHWNACLAAHVPSPEICGDEFDNDCDGAVDAGDADCWECRPPEARACALDLPGVCAGGLQTCGADGFWGVCVSDGQPSPEVCGDGLDNDCDGQTDRADVDCATPTLDCGSAQPSISVIWPPNKTLIPVTIVGVLGSEGASAAVTVESITQDEPVSGNKSPDGIGVGTAMAHLRSDRLGNGHDGRLYVITFTATDSNGETCRGSVTVCVPHDRDRLLCTDDGQRYDSTAVPGKP